MSNWPLEDCQAEVGASEIMLPFLHGAAPAARPRYLFEVSCEHVQCLVDFQAEQRTRRTCMATNSLTVCG